MLHSVKEEIAPHLKHYHDAYHQLAASEMPLVNDIGNYMMQKPGKEMRPMLMMLTALCCGMPFDSDKKHPVYRAAAAVEMLHNSSLLHDDVIDEATIRRGRDTVNARWDNKTAVLAGDYFLSRVMMAVNALQHDEVTRVVNNTVATMSIGELIQHQNIGNYAISEATYRQIIGSKTAALISASCEVGALLSSNATVEEIAAAKQFGEALGIAFQIRDDMRDYLPSDLTGKPQGNDLREHRVTMPLILALQQYNKEDLLPLLQQDTISDADLSTIIDTVRKCGAIEETHSIMQHEIKKAQEMLLLMRENKYRHHLECGCMVMSTQ